MNRRLYASGRTLWPAKIVSTVMFTLFITPANEAWSLNAAPSANWFQSIAARASRHVPSCPVRRSYIRPALLMKRSASVGLFSRNSAGSALYVCPGSSVTRRVTGPLIRFSEVVVATISPFLSNVVSTRYWSSSVIVYSWEPQRMIRSLVLTQCVRSLTSMYV